MKKRMAAIEKVPSIESAGLANLPTKETFSFNEASDASLIYFGGDELAAKVWVTKYALKDSFGNIFEKDPDDMHRRIASEVARIDARYPNPMSYDEILGLLKDFKYIIPQGSPMTGIGNPFQVASLSNCFVIGNDGSADSYGGIMKIDQEQVQLMKRRGAWGMICRTSGRTVPLFLTALSH